VSVAEANGTPSACSLDLSAMPGRLAEWERVLACTRRRIEIDGGLRVEFPPRVDLGDIARLVAAEQQCCAFFDFAITVDGRGVGLEVRAPDEASEILTTVFGDAA